MIIYHSTSTHYFITVTVRSDSILYYKCLCTNGNINFYTIMIICLALAPPIGHAERARDAMSTQEWYSNYTGALEGSFLRHI